MLLKHTYNLGDETVLTAWVQNPYFQYFSSIDTFQWKAHCNGSDMAHFPKHIGVSGVEKIFQYTVKMQGPEVLEETLITDTTVQETNITFPTDTKLHIKIIGKCIKIADSSGIELRQRYPWKVKQH
jgi:IS5 family transposase